jgi:signal transduction histidine kinase
MRTSMAQRAATQPGHRAIAMRAGVVYGSAATLVAVAVTLGASASTDQPVISALLRGVIVAAPSAAAVYALREPGFARFGRLLLAVGLLSFVSTFSESGNATLYTIGRLGGWGVELALVVLVLSFPTGRLETRIDRTLALAMGAIVTFLLVTAAVGAPTYPVPSPWTSCTRDCPANVLYLLHDPLVGFNPLVVASGLLFVVLLALVVRLQQRSESATGLRRQMLLPLLWVSMARAALVGCGFAWRVVAPDSSAVEVCSWLIALLTPAVSLAFLVGLVRMRLFAEQAVVTLARAVSRPLDARALQRTFAYALADPGIEIVFPSPAGAGEWIDVDGRSVAEPAPDTQRLHPVRDRDGTTVAGLVCAATLAEHPALLDAGASIASVSLDNLRLAAEAAAAERELRRSRARIAAAADDERRRIERDLHDGAQQRLVALRIELGLVEDLARQDPERCVERVRELEESVEVALEELRSLAHGVRPPLLEARGLAEALPVAASRAPVPVTVRLTDVGRYPPEVESAVYFCVLEALQNVAKHAGGAARAVLELDGGGHQLRFSVRDDGPGAPDARLSGGMGVTNMQDRIAAVGGRLTLRSRPGMGTSVEGAIPLRP